MLQHTHTCTRTHTNLDKVAVLCGGVLSIYQHPQSGLELLLRHLTSYDVREERKDTKKINVKIGTYLHDSSGALYSEEQGAQQH